MKKISAIQVVLVSLLSFGVGCSTATLIETRENNAEMRNEALRTGFLAEGDVSNTYYFNDDLIAGKSKSYVDAAKQAQFNTMLEALELVNVNADQNFSNAEIVFLKRKDGRAFSYKNDPALAQLRKAFGLDFGPVILDTTHAFQGGLKNQIIVKFSSEISDSLASKIITDYGGVNAYYMTDQKSFIVDFPLDWGFHLVDVGKKMLHDRRIIFCQNLYHTPPKRHH